MDVERLFTHENVAALAYAVNALKGLAKEQEDDFEKALLSRASVVCLYLLREITKEWSAKNGL